MKTWKKVISFVLAVVCIVSLMSTMSLSASAASANVKVSAVKGVTLQNVKTGEYLNFDYGTLKNGQPVRVWPRDGSTEQLWSIVHISGTTYRIVTYKSSKYALDIYRGNSALKASQQADIWKAGGDTKAQNVQFYLCDDGSYIIRMANNNKLALSATSSKGRVKLAKFDASSSAQKWVFKNSKGSKINIQSGTTTTTTTTVSAPSGIPVPSFKKTGVVYTVSGTKYYEAKTTKAYNGVAANSIFFVDSNNKVVNKADTLNKLYALNLFNEVRTIQKSAAEGWVSAAQDYYSIYTNIAATEKMGEVIGKGSGALLSLGAGNSLTLKESLIELGDSVVSLDTLKAASLLGMVRYYTNNVIANGNKVAGAMNSTITDYDTMVAAVSAYAECAASFGAVEYLIGDQIRDLSKSSTLKELDKYFDNVVVSFADSIIPDLKAVEVTKAITDGVVSLSEMAVNSGAASVHDKRLTEQKAFLSKSYASAKSVADKLASSKDWGSLVGKTVANIKDGSSYTKWYGSGNISAKAGYDGECTWYALGRFYEVTGIALKTAPHAKKWLSANKDDTRVKILNGADKIVSGSICVNTGGTYGHVMYIEYVEYENDKPVTVYFTECNYDGNSSYNAGKDCILQKMSYSKFVSQRSPDGYIVAK